MVSNVAMAPGVTAKKTSLIKNKKGGKLSEEFTQPLNYFKWMFDMFLTGLLGAAPTEEINENTAEELALDPEFLLVKEYPTTVKPMDGELGFWDKTKNVMLL